MNVCVCVRVRARKVLKSSMTIKTCLLPGTDVQRLLMLGLDRVGFG